MKVQIIAGGRFHSFDLFKELSKNGVDVSMLTSYPKFKLKQFDLKSAKIKSFPFVEYWIRGWYRLFKKYPNNYFTSLLFGKWASLNLDVNVDFYIIWAGYALECIPKIRKLNTSAKIIIERGSSHIEIQNEILKHFGGNPIDLRMIEKEKKEYESCDAISIPSTFVKKSFIDKGVAENKLFVNPYGVNLEEFNILPALNKQNNVFTIGYAGILSHRKNTQSLIDVVNSLIEDGQNLKLNLIGNIDSESFSEKSLIKPHINYQKAIPQNQLINFYNNLDVFILNSFDDGFGMVIIQALACGVPVIATENTGGPDIIRNDENGYIIPVNDNKALTEAILKVKGLTEKGNEMGNFARKSVERNFKWEDYGKRYYNYLNTCNK